MRGGGELLLADFAMGRFPRYYRENWVAAFPASTTPVISERLLNFRGRQALHRNCNSRLIANYVFTATFFIELNACKWRAANWPLNFCHASFVPVRSIVSKRKKPPLISSRALLYRVFQNCEHKVDGSMGHQKANRKSENGRRIFMLGILITLPFSFQRAILIS